MVTVELTTGTAVARLVPMKTPGADTGYIDPDWESPYGPELGAPSALPHQFVPPVTLTVAPDPPVEADSVAVDCCGTGWPLKKRSREV